METVDLRCGYSMLEEKGYVDIIGAHFSAGAGGCGNLPEGEITEDNPVSYTHLTLPTNSLE